jgi:hypothetical protein
MASPVVECQPIRPVRAELGVIIRISTATGTATITGAEACVMPLIVASGF